MADWILSRKPMFIAGESVDPKEFQHAERNELFIGFSGFFKTYSNRWL